KLVGKPPRFAERHQGPGQADVGDLVFRAAVRTAGEVDRNRFEKRGLLALIRPKRSAVILRAETCFKTLQQLPRRPLGVGDGERAELGSGTGEEVQSALVPFQREPRPFQRRPDPADLPGGYPMKLDILRFGEMDLAVSIPPRNPAESGKLLG